MSALLLVILELFPFYVGIGGGGGGGGGAGALLDIPFFPDFLVSTADFVTTGVCGRVGLNLGGGGMGRFFVIFFKSMESSLVIVELDEVDDRELESLESLPRYRFILILLAITAMASCNDEEDELLRLPVKVLDDPPDPAT